MWIIPKNYHGSFPLLRDMEDSKLVLSEHLEKSPSSLMWRSKASPLRTWLIRWKRDKWFRRLSGRILKLSMQESFEESLTFSLVGSLANHFHAPASNGAQMTLGTFGHSSKKLSKSVGPGKSSSKTSKDSFQQKPSCTVRSSLDIAKKLNNDWVERGGLLSGEDLQDYAEFRFSNMSCGDWKDWVTNARLEYSQRKKSAHLIEENECLSWPSPAASQGKQGQTESDGKRSQTLVGAARGQNCGTPRVAKNNGHPNKSATGKESRLEDQVVMWPTAAARDWKDTPGMSTTRPDRKGHGRIDQLPRAVFADGQLSEVNPNTNGKNLESWTTPVADDTGFRKQKYSQGGSALSLQAWSTPEAQNNKGYHNQKDGTQVLKLGSQAGTGKLNPNWVEQLQGLPVGWAKFTDGDNRVDRLRLLGNGVVPQTAEKAFIVLSQKLNSSN